MICVNLGGYRSGLSRYFLGVFFEGLTFIFRFFRHVTGLVYGSFGYRRGSFGLSTDLVFQ